MSDLLRSLPQVDQVLRDLPALESLGPEVARWLVRAEIESARERALRGADPGDVRASVARRAALLSNRGLRRVVNATGVVLHTNLGRAPLSRAAREAVDAASAYAAVEYDAESGERGERAPVAGALAAALCGAEDALVVNNNAGALLLALAALARGKGTVVSRGQLIEIGGEFRLPELMEASGTILREVGTTNRTHARDYRTAIDAGAALVLVVHPSNYEVVGFATQPPLQEVVAIAHEAGLPVLYDVGSGLLAPEPGALAGEPDARSALEAGCDLVCFSGDKLLGGPQAGIIAGSARLVGLCRRHPIARAVRAGKMTLAALEATLRAHATGALDTIPARRMLDATVEEIGARARRLTESLPAGAAGLDDGSSVTGGGSLPGGAIPTVLLAIAHPRPDRLAAALRAGDPPVVARIEEGRLVLDLRTVDPQDDALVALRLAAALASEDEAGQRP